MIQESDRSFLKTYLPFLVHLDEAGVRTVETSLVTAGFSEGEQVQNHHQECNGLVIVKEGQFRTFFETEDGKEITLYRLLAGDICVLSASCVLKNITFEVVMEAEKPGVLYFLPAMVLSSLSLKYAAVREFISDLVAERFSDVMWVMEQMVSKNMGQRVAAFLLEQAVLEGSDDLETTHETIAKNIGTAREVVSRVLKYLEEDGLLGLSRGHIRLQDRKKLSEMSR